MSAEYEKYYRIDRFLRGELNNEELEAFQKELALDPDFAAEVANQQEVNELISANAYHELRVQMSQDIAKFDQRSSYKYWLGAGLLIAILSLSTYFYFDKKSEEVASSKKENGEFTDKKREIALENKKTEAQRQVKPTPSNSKDRKPKEELNDDNKIAVPSLPENDKVVKDLQDHSTPVGNEFGNTKDPIVENKSSDILPNHPCSKVSIVAPYNVVNACAGKPDGAISINKKHITGGNAPYSVELFHSDSKVPPFYYDQLNSGTYLLKVSDVNGCEETWNVKVGEKVCNTKDISIAPAYGEKWEYGGNEGDTYYISIFNQAGQLVYKSSLLTGNTEWTGVNSSGVPVDTGLYIYIVEYTNGKKEMGQITVIR